MKHYSTAPAPGIRMHLLHPHTHAGQPYDIGEVITVDAGTADWLARQRIARVEADKPARKSRWAAHEQPVSDAGHPSGNPDNPPSESDHE